MKEEEHNKNLGFKELSELVECSYDGEVIQLSDAIDEAYETTVKKCLEFGKTSEMTIKVKFSCEDSKRIRVVSELNTKLPKSSPTTRSVYHDQKGNLRKEDPSLPKDLPGLAPLKRVS